MMDEVDEEVHCIECDESKDFAYIGTKANGDFWRCRNCNTEFESTVKVL